MRTDVQTTTAGRRYAQFDDLKVYLQHPDPLPERPVYVDYAGLLPQILDAVQENRLRQVAELLGDPEPDIGGPGDQRSVGIGLVIARQLVARRGAEGAGEAACLPGPLRGYFRQEEGGTVAHPVRHRVRNFRGPSCGPRSFPPQSSEFPCVHSP